MYYNDGDKYEGYYKNNKKEGKGDIFYKNEVNVKDIIKMIKKDHVFYFLVILKELFLAVKNLLKTSYY